MNGMFSKVFSNILERFLGICCVDHFVLPCHEPDHGFAYHDKQQ